MVTSGGMQSAQQELCLQCEKTVAPSPTVAIEVTNEQGKVMGYLHRTGTCEAEWANKRTAKASGTPMIDTETGRVQNLKPGDFI
jgi:Na+-translocating ferredoxin:NAD+ oxidoreductase RNF subunit RnfB